MAADGSIEHGASKERAVLPLAPWLRTNARAKTASTHGQWPPVGGDDVVYPHEAQGHVSHATDAACGQLACGAWRLRRENNAAVTAGTEVHHRKTETRVSADDAGSVQPELATFDRSRRREVAMQPVSMQQVAKTPHAMP